MTRHSQILGTLTLCLAGTLAYAETPEQLIRNSLTAAQPDLQIQTVTESPLAGLYEAHLSAGRVLYFSPDGQYMLQGHMFQFSENQTINLTEQIQNRAIAKEITAVPLQDMVVYSPAQPKTHITVFTDSECGYCQKLHQEIPELNAAGVEVRYMAFPRQGPGSPGYDALVNVWCASDRQAAMNQVKRRESLPVVQCDNPVSKQFALGDLIGIQGTPAIVLPNGKMIPGYRPAAELTRLALAAE